jgi:hypothetical protein
MTRVLLIVAVACLIFSTPDVADAKDKTQATAGQPQQSSMATTPRRAMTLKSSFRGDERTSVPSANRDYCRGQY